MAKNEKQIAKALGANGAIKISNKKAGGPLGWLHLLAKVENLRKSDLRIGKTFKELHEQSRFVRNGSIEDNIRPGDIFKSQVDGTEYLVGDINILGGVCDDCSFNDVESIFMMNLKDAFEKLLKS